MQLVPIMASFNFIMVPFFDGCCRADRLLGRFVGALGSRIADRVLIAALPFILRARSGHSRARVGAVEGAAARAYVDFLALIRGFTCPLQPLQVSACAACSVERRHF